MRPIKDKGIAKFDGGRIMILCNGCRTYLKAGEDLTDEEIEMLSPYNDQVFPPQYCEKCKPTETE